MRAASAAAGLWLAAAMAGCASAPPAGVAAAPTAAPDEPVRLGWRQPLALPDGLVLELVGLEEDSRCPAGVQCVWAGRATVAIAVFKGAAAPRRFKLSLPGPAATYQDYGLTLVALEPAPVSGRRAPEAELVATVAIGPAQNLR